MDSGIPGNRLSAMLTFMARNFELAPVTRKPRKYYRMKLIRHKAGEHCSS
jgi:hypothetical protein